MFGKRSSGGGGGFVRNSWQYQQVLYVCKYTYILGKYDVVAPKESRDN